jgi:hypothetical protein
MEQMNDYQKQMLFCIEGYRNICKSDLAESMLQLFCNYENLPGVYEVTKDRITGKTLKAIGPLNGR